MIQKRIENLNYLILLGLIVNGIGRRLEMPSLEYTSAGIAILTLLIIVFSFSRVRRVWDKHLRRALYWRIAIAVVCCIILLLIVFL